MNLKTTYILFGILAIVLGGLALTQLLGVGKSASQSDFIFPELHAKKEPVKDDDIETVRVEHSDSNKAGTLVFARDDQKKWEMREPRNYRVDTYAVNSLANEVIGATKEKVEVGKDLKEYELDKPRIVVTVTKGDQEWKLNVGKQSQGRDPYVYVTTAKRPKEPVAVKKSKLAGVFKSVNEFRARELVSANSSEVESVELQPGGKKDALVLEKGTGSKWTFKKPAAFGEADYEGDGPPPLATETRKITGVLGLLQAVTGLRVEGDADFVADNVAEQEMKDKYGLEGSNPATLRIDVKSAKTKVGDEARTTTTETLLIGKKVPEEKEDKKDDKKDDKKEDKKPDPNKVEFFYARLSNENSVVKVPLKKVESLVQLANEPDVLRDRTLAQFDRAKVDAIQIENAEGTIKLFKTDPLDAWKLWRDKAGANAEENTIRALLDSLDPKKEGKRRIESFPAIKPEQAGIDKNTRLAVVSLWSDGVKKQEKKDAEPELTDPKTPTVRLTFGKQDKDRGLVYVLREVAGEKEPTLLLVKDKEAGKDGVVDRVTPGPLAYLDRKIPSFGMTEGTEIKQLILMRGGETFQIKREKSGEIETWKFESPKELAGRLADRRSVEDIVFLALQRLSPVRVASEKANDKQLESFGLKPPQLEATVVLSTKDSKEEKYTYAFGKETPDKAGVFFKSSRTDLVYVVQASVLAPLQAELQDKTIFTFDPDKVRGLKLTGWKNLFGSPHTLELERKSKSSWVAKSPPGFELEPITAESFLFALANLKALKLVKGGPKPEFGFDLAKNPALMVMEISVDGEKEPVKLTLGNLDPAEKAYFAMSSTMKDQVFHVPEEIFKRVLEKPAYFTKTGQ